MKRYTVVCTHKSLLIEIVHNQFSFLGHVIQKDDLEGLVVAVFVDGKRAKGTPRETYISKMINKSPLEMIKDDFRMAKKKFGGNGVRRAIYVLGYNTQ